MIGERDGAGDVDQVGVVQVAEQDAHHTDRQVGVRAEFRDGRERPAPAQSISHGVPDPVRAGAAAARRSLARSARSGRRTPRRSAGSARASSRRAGPSGPPRRRTSGPRNRPAGHSGAIIRPGNPRIRGQVLADPLDQHRHLVGDLADVGSASHRTARQLPSPAAVMNRKASSSSIMVCRTPPTPKCRPAPWPGCGSRPPPRPGARRPRGPAPARRHHQAVTGEDDRVPQRRDPIHQFVQEPVQVAGRCWAIRGLDRSFRWCGSCWSDRAPGRAATCCIKVSMLRVASGDRSPAPA